nr:hypothetical protein SHINE37_120248 [Rhizobiaceae bacterium]
MQPHPAGNPLGERRRGKDIRSPESRRRRKPALQFALHGALGRIHIPQTARMRSRP